MTDTPPRTSPRKLAIKLIKMVLLIAVLLFVGRALVRDFSRVDWSGVRVDWLPLIGAFFTLIAVPISLVPSYRALLSSYVRPAPTWSQIAAAIWMPMLVKYIPGKVASFAVPVVLLKQAGVPAAAGLSLMLVLDGVMVLSGLVVGSPLLLWPSLREQFPWAPLLIVPMIVAGLIALHPRVFFGLLNIALRTMKRATIDTIPPARAYLVPVIIATLNWFFVGLTLYLLAEAFGESSPDQLLKFISIGALAYTISYLVVLSPGGIGPREAVLLLGLGVVMQPAELAAVVTVALRLVQIAMEATISLTGWMVWRRANS